MGSTVIDDKKRSLREGTNNPEFYLSYEFKVVLPGKIIIIVIIKGLRFCE